MARIAVHHPAAATRKVVTSKSKEGSSFVSLDAASLTTGVLAAGAGAVAGAADGAWSTWGTSIGNAFEQANPSLAFETTTTVPGYQDINGHLTQVTEISHTTSNLTDTNLVPVGMEAAGLLLIAAPLLFRAFGGRRRSR